MYEISPSASPAPLLTCAHRCAVHTPANSVAPNPRVTAYPVVPTLNKGARRAFIYGILGFVCLGFILGPIAIMEARQAEREIRSSRGYQSGSEMATAGLILGIVSTALWVVSLVHLWLARSTGPFR